MRELERHILRLLLDNDCVIVPGFGGFMAHHMPARYDERVHVFSPPTRVVGFNPQLSMNDSLLANEYANTYDLSYPEALKQISKDVDFLKEEIGKKGIYEICGIGTFVAQANGTYEFTPEETGLATPSLYGLGASEILPLTREASDETRQETPFGFPTQRMADKAQEPGTPNERPSDAVPTQETHEDDSEDTISVHIPMRYVKRLAVACVVLLVMLTIPSKLGEASKTDTKQSCIDTSLLYEIMPKDMTQGKPDHLEGSTPEQDTKVEEAATKEVKEAKRDEGDKTIVTDEDGKDAGNFTIVLASRVTRTNAENFVEKLHKKGYGEAQVYTKNGSTKVIYKKFKTRQEASKSLNALTDNIDFEGCWITEIK